MKVIDIETASIEVKELNKNSLEYLIDKDKQPRVRNRFFKNQDEFDLDTLEFDTKSIGRPELNKIICCAIRNTNSTPPLICYYIGDEIPELPEAVPCKDEKELLEKVNEELKEGSLVGFNSNEFDLPFIKFRSAIHGLKSPIKWDIKPWSTDYIDLRHWLGGKYAVGTLEYWCGIFNIKIPNWGGEKEHGSKIGTWFKNKQYYKIVKGCLEDVIATWELYEKLK